MKFKKTANMENSFERRLQKGNWWENGNECLNLHDINKPPQYYTGTDKEWIEEITTYIYLYPVEWQTIFEQYKSLSKKGLALQFYRNEEGYQTYRYHVVLHGFLIYLTLIARSLCLDAYGADSTGKKYDLEVQKGEEEASPHRARYHSSVMDIENLNAGQEFEELPDTYVIFIVDEDVYGKGEPLYPIERINLA